MTWRPIAVALTLAALAGGASPALACDRDPCIALPTRQDLEQKVASTVRENGEPVKLSGEGDRATVKVLGKDVVRAPLGGALNVDLGGSQAKRFGFTLPSPRP